MRSSRAGYRLVGLLVVGVLLLLVPLQGGIHKGRPDLFGPKRGARPSSLVTVGPTAAVIAALGGFRTLAADLLWLKVEHVWHGGAWWALLPLLEGVTELDPHFLTAWKVYGWHCAYNLHAESETVVDRRYWLNRGLEILERAVEANPKSWEMIFELGWTYFDRAHEPYRAWEYFKLADEFPEAPHYVTRMRYRPFEAIMDFETLFPELEYAKSRHLDDDNHQSIVQNNLRWWRENWNKPREHWRQIVRENTKRAERGLPFWEYRGDPFWEVCPICGMPSPKGSDVCQVCRNPLPKAEGPEEAPAAPPQ